MQKGPEFDISEDQAPEATFSYAGSRKGESKGSRPLVEDLTAEIANGIQAGDGAQAEFEKQVHTAQELMVSLEERKTNLEEEHA